MKSKLILHVSQPGEAGVATVLLSYLTRAEPDVAHVVACPDGSVLAEGVRRLGYRHVPWEATRGPGRALPREARDLRQILRKVQPDLVHLHSSQAGLVGRLVVRGSLPTVFQPHAWSFSAVEGVTRIMSRQWERWAQRWTHATVCVSRDEQVRGQTHGVLHEGHRTRGGYVLPNAVDPADWRTQDQAAARTRLGLPAEVPVAVCVGRLCRQKGQDLLLSAWPRVTREVRANRGRPDGPGPLLVLVGEGPDRPALENARTEGVTLVGRDDPRLWYAAADVAIVPSRWEAMAMVPLEAQAAGRLVVATDVDGMRERLHQDQPVVPVDCPDTLAQAMITALSDPDAAARIGARARLLAEEQWSVHRDLAALRDIYSTAEAGHRG